MATVRIQLRRGTSSQWDTANPTLAAGEIGIETDTNTFKFGDGTTAWNSLDYALSNTVDDYILLADKGVANGVATLDGSGKVPYAQIPSIDELSQDAVNSALVAGTGITKVYNDGANTITVAVDTSVIATKAELAEVSQDSINDALVAGVGLDKTYDDVNNLITIDIDSTVVTLTGAQTLTNKTITSPLGIVKADVGLGNVDNTSDADKPVSTAQAAADTAVANAASSALASHESDTTGIHGIADTSILVTTTGTQTLLSKSLTSPTLTGTPTAPTATAGTDTTQIATTAFVQDAIELVVGAAPAALNTLSEIATSLNNDADLAGTLTSSISTKVAKSGDTMSGILDMGSNKITNLSNPTSNNDAATKQYTDGTAENRVSSHAATTTSIHGISDTANLVYTSDVRLSDVRIPEDNSVSTIKIQDLNVTTAKLNDSSVTTDKINNSAVTTAKIADSNVTTAKIADSNVTTAKIADDAITSLKIADLNVTTAKIADLNVTTAKIADSNVTAAKIADSSVGVSKLASDSVSTSKIIDSNVTTNKIADENVTAAKLATDSVITIKIADSNVTTAKIADGNITTDKLAASSVVSAKIADGAVTSGKIADGTIVDADINASAAIAQSKISGLSASFAAKADLAGPTFTGTVTLPSTTSIGNVSATELGYVDGVTSAIQTQLDAKLASATAASTYAPIASPTFTGTVSGVSKSMVGLGNVDNTSDANKPVSTATQTALDAKLSLSGGTMTGALTLSGAPTLDAHAATKAYVDNVSAGINFHQPVRVATTGNITLSGTQTIDGVAVVAGDRVLVKDQTNQTQNGIYVVAAGSWSRATDADNTPSGELAGGDFSLVLEGTVNSGYGYVCSNTSAITIGTTNITYAAFNAAKAVTAGSGLTESTPGTLDIATGGVTSAMIADGTIVDGDINASAAIAQSKISNLTTDLAAKAPLASPTFTGTVTLSASGISFTDGTQTKAGVPSLTTIGTTIGAAYNLSTGGLALRDQLIPISGTYAVTVPANSTTAYPVGTSISFYQSAGTGANFVEAAGVTILRTPGLKLRTTNSSATLTKVATDTWLLAGDLSA